MGAAGASGEYSRYRDTSNNLGSTDSGSYEVDNAGHRRGGELSKVQVNDEVLHLSESGDFDRGKTAGPYSLERFEYNFGGFDESAQYARDHGVLSQSASYTQQKLANVAYSLSQSGAADFGSVSKSYTDETQRTLSSDYLESGTYTRGTPGDVKSGTFEHTKETSESRGFDLNGSFTKSSTSYKLSNNEFEFQSNSYSESGTYVNDATGVKNSRNTELKRDELSRSKSVAGHHNGRKVTDDGSKITTFGTQDETEYSYSYSESGVYDSDTFAWYNSADFERQSRYLKRHYDNQDATFDDATTVIKWLVTNKNLESKLFYDTGTYILDDLGEHKTGKFGGSDYQDKSKEYKEDGSWAAGSYLDEYKQVAGSAVDKSNGEYDEYYDSKNFTTERTEEAGFEIGSSTDSSGYYFAESSQTSGAAQYQHFHDQEVSYRDGAGEIGDYSVNILDGTITAGVTRVPPYQKVSESFVDEMDYTSNSDYYDDGAGNVNENIGEASASYEFKYVDKDYYTLTLANVTDSATYRTETDRPFYELDLFEETSQSYYHSDSSTWSTGEHESISRMVQVNSVKIHEDNKADEAAPKRTTTTSYSHAWSYYDRYCDFGVCFTSGPAGDSDSDDTVTITDGTPPEAMLEPAEAQTTAPEPADEAVAPPVATYNGDFLDRSAQFVSGWAHSLTFGGMTKLNELLWGDIAKRNHQGALFDAGQWVGMGHSFLVGVGSSGLLGRAGLGAQRAINFAQKYDLAGAVIGVGQSTYKLSIGQFKATDALGFIPAVGWGIGKGLRYFTASGLANKFARFANARVLQPILRGFKMIPEAATGLQNFVFQKISRGLAGIGGLVRGGTKGARAVDDIPATTPKSPTRSPSCNSFLGHTLVLMADGTTRRIDQIKIGDWVLAVDPATDIPTPRKVTAVIIGNGQKQLVEVTIAGQTVTATDDHPFWVESRSQWVHAIDLRAGDVLVNPDGSIAVVDSVFAYVINQQTAYNLTVADDHTFFVMVGDEAVLVHNCGEKVPDVEKLKKLDDVPWGQYCRTGCEDVAARIRKTIGGQIHEIKPKAGLPGNPSLGLRDGRPTDWFTHEVVVKGGRVYDALTGPEGILIEEFKKLWAYADVIDFGF